ncbi:PH domain-containing protein [Streptomyces roseirectus]|uniref:PH domain-containing protein n=1 Tax=Streptomyces roseirectus TaxID=2768066 RepID=A0A7H0IGF0_9ACTN|nr:PH domain-containing protein [Streptomyces roseirectus]QNP71866.1 PH domain-containing protein [Streptomyces roseirectus]
MGSEPRIERTYRGGRALPLPDVLLLLAIAFLVAPAGDEPTLRELPYLVLGLAAGAYLLLDRFRARTTVSASGITVQGPLRTRHVPWADVQDLRIPADGFRTRWQARFPVHLYDTNGASLRLPHFDERQLASVFDELDDVVGAAGQLGLWERREPDERVARGERRRAAWTRASHGAVLALAVTIGLAVLSLLLDGPSFAIDLIVPVPLVVLAVLFLVFDRLGEARATVVQG